MAHPTPVGPRQLIGSAPDDESFRDVIARAVAYQEAVDGRSRRPVTPRVPFGPRGFGHSRDRSAMVEHEANAIRQAASRVLSGETLSRIVADWNDAGLRTTMGRSWHVSSLARLLVQPRLAGYAREGGGGTGTAGLDTTVGPPIIDRSTHDQLVARQRSRALGPRAPARVYLLSGLLRCSLCGGRMHGGRRSGKSIYYVCPPPGHGGCSGVGISEPLADDAVVELVLERVESVDLAAGFRRRAQALAEEIGDVDELARGILAGQRQLAELAKLWTAGRLSEVEWADLRHRVESRLRVEEAGLERMAALDNLLGGIDPARLRSAWPAQTLPQRSRHLADVVDHVVVLPADRRRTAFASERLRPVWTPPFAVS